MATLSELDARGDLFKLDPVLRLGVLEERLIYLSPRAARWIAETLPGEGSTWNIEVSPLEQMASLTESFCSGEELMYGHRFKVLRHKEDGIWELKSADIRVFGWFNCRDVFVAAFADTAQHVKDFNLYHGYCGEVARFRTQLDLDEPKHVPGEDPHAVVSNYSYP